MSNQRVEANRGHGVKGGQFGFARDQADAATADDRAGALDDSTSEGFYDSDADFVWSSEAAYDAFQDVNFGSSPHNGVYETMKALDQVEHSDADRDHCFEVMAEYMGVDVSEVDERWQARQQDQEIEAKGAAAVAELEPTGSEALDKQIESAIYHIGIQEKVAKPEARGDMVVRDHGEDRPGGGPRFRTWNAEPQKPGGVLPPAAERTEPIVARITPDRQVSVSPWYSKENFDKYPPIGERRTIGDNATMSSEKTFNNGISFRAVPPANAEHLGQAVGGAQVVESTSGSQRCYIVDTGKTRPATKTRGVTRIFARHQMESVAGTNADGQPAVMGAVGERVGELYVLDELTS